MSSPRDPKCTRPRFDRSSAKYRRNVSAPTVPRGRRFAHCRKVKSARPDRQQLCLSAFARSANTEGNARCGLSLFPHAARSCPECVGANCEFRSDVNPTRKGDFIWLGDHAADRLGVPFRSIWHRHRAHRRVDAISICASVAHVLPKILVLHVLNAGPPRHARLQRGRARRAPRG